MADLIAEKQIAHNYDNEKVEKWLIENHEPSIDQVNWGCEGGNNWGCSCDTYEKFEDFEYDDGYIKPMSLGFFVEVDGKEMDYVAYYDKYDWEYLVKAIKDLTEEEKEELEDIGNLRVYYCGVCHEWALDGDNL